MPQGHRGPQSPARLFAMDLARGPRDRLGEGLVGVYLHGRVATGEDVPGKSDADPIAVCANPLPAGQRDSLRELLVASAPPPGLPVVDLGVLTAGAAACPERLVRGELVLRGEREGDCLAVSDLGGYPGDLLDVEMARQHGVALVGPDPREGFAPAPAVWVLGACAEALRKWARRCRYAGPASGLLHACRAWRYAEEGALSSKAGGGEWARPRTAAPALIDAAPAVRRGKPGVAMPDGAVNAFVRRTLQRVEDVARPGRAG